MESTQEVFEKVKELDWSSALVSFYVIKRTLSHRKASYKVLSVNTDESLREKLRNIATGRVTRSNAAREYEYTTSDLDQEVLAIGTSETDLQTIVDQIVDGQNPIEAATGYEQLLGSWMYISRLDLPGQLPLFSARRVSENWTTKKVSQLVSFIFEDEMLVDLKEEDIFRIDSKVDFFAYDGVIFVADKKNFEAALNFREGMERNRDEIIEEFKEQELFVNAEEISTLVGDNIKRLRKLSQVKKAGYFRDQIFLRNLRRVNDSENWGLSYDASGKMQVEEANIELVLRVLNNDRLHSQINEEDFDVDVKHKVAGG